MKLPGFRLLITTCLITFCCNFPYGYQVYVNPAVNAIHDFVNRTYVKKHNEPISEETFHVYYSIMGNLGEIGAMVTTFCIPYLSDTFGRKKPILFGTLPNLLGVAMQLAGLHLLNFETFCVGRLLQGVSAAMGISMQTIYLTESAPTEWRGFIASFQELALALTTTLGCVLGFPSVLGQFERLDYLIGCAAVPSIILLITCLLIPDTPKFLLLSKQNEKAAAKAVTFFHKDPDVPTVLANIKREGKLEEAEHCVTTVGKGSLLPLLTTYRFPLLMGITCLVAAQVTAVMPFLEYSSELLQLNGVNSNLASQATLIMMISNCVATLVSTSVIEQFKRRTLLLGSLSAVLVCDCAYVVFTQLHFMYGWEWTNYANIIVLILFAIVFSFGAGPLPWFLMSEMIPHAYRSTAQTIGIQIMHMLSVGLALGILPLYKVIQGYSFVVLCIGPLAVCIVILYKYLPETRGKEVADVVAEMIGKEGIRDLYALETATEKLAAATCDIVMLSYKPINSIKYKYNINNIV